MRKSDAALLVFAFLGPVFLFLGLFIRWAIKKQNARRAETLRRIAESFGTPTMIADAKSAVARMTSQAIETELGGNTYRIFTFVRGRYEYCEMQLVTAANLPLVVFRPENGRDRLGRALFLNREVQLGDRAFDDAVYIESDERDEHVQQTLAEPAMRQAVLDAVKAGNAITLSKHGVSMVIPISFATPAKEQIEQRIGFLEQLAKGVRNVDGADGTWTGNRGDTLPVAMYIAMAATYLALMISTVADAARWEPLHAVGQKLPNQIGTIGLLAFVVFAFVYVRGHSRSLRNFFLMLFPAIFVIPFAPSVILWGANAAFDSAPTSTTRGHVVELPHYKDGRYTTYRVRLAVDEAQTPPQYLSYKKLSLIIPFGTYRTLAVGDPIEVVVHRGAFEWPWIGPVRKSAP